MKEWKLVFGTEENSPGEFDKLSSPNVAYQRRNIVRKEIVDSSGNVVLGWEREEREMTHQELSNILDSLDSPSTKLIMQTLAELQLQVDMLS